MDTRSFEKSLLQRKETILARVNALESDRRGAHRAPEQSYEDHAQNLENDEVVDALDDLERKELTDIEMALEKIQQGKFGTCEECEEAIESARLKALPFSRYCIQCAKENEI